MNSIRSLGVLFFLGLTIVVTETAHSDWKEFLLTRDRSETELIEFYKKAYRPHIKTLAHPVMVFHYSDLNDFGVPNSNSEPEEAKVYKEKIMSIIRMGLSPISHPCPSNTMGCGLYAAGNPEVSRHYGKRRPGLSALVLRPTTRYLDTNSQDVSHRECGPAFQGQTHSDKKCRDSSKAALRELNVGFLAYRWKGPQIPKDPEGCTFRLMTAFVILNSSALDLQRSEFFVRPLEEAASSSQLKSLILHYLAELGEIKGVYNVSGFQEWKSNFIFGCAGPTGAKFLEDLPIYGPQISKDLIQQRKGWMPQPFLSSRKFLDLRAEQIFGRKLLSLYPGLFNQFVISYPAIVESLKSAMYSPYYAGPPSREVIYQHIRTLFSRWSLPTPPNPKTIQSWFQAADAGVDKVRNLPDPYSHSYVSPRAVGPAVENFWLAPSDKKLKLLVRLSVMDSITSAQGLPPLPLYLTKTHQTDDDRFDVTSSSSAMDEGEELAKNAAWFFQ